MAAPPSESNQLAETVGRLRINGVALADVVKTDGGRTWHQSTSPNPRLEYRKNRPPPINAVAANAAVTSRSEGPGAWPASRHFRYASTTYASGLMRAMN